MKPIFIDVDGTLRNSQKEITAATQEALQLASQNHYEPIICTGRPRDYALKLCEQLQSNYLIYNSGAGIYDCKNQTIMHEDSMSSDSITELYNLVQKENVNFILAYDGTNHRYSLGKTTQYKPLSPNDLDHILSANDIQQVIINGANFDFMYSLHEQINQISHIKTSNQSKCLIDLSLPHTATDFYYDVVDVNTSKGNGIKKFCELLRTPLQSCIAIGDDENDISMFQVCGYSVAMGNALPSVKAIANYITLDNDHDGIAHFIHEQLLS